MNIIELYDSGMSTRKIASVTGKSAATIWRYVRKHGQVRNKSESLRGDKHPLYKGGHVNRAGYKVIWVDGKLVAEHRQIMERHLGRKLITTEHVHHRDHNKLNNSIDNLELTTVFDHQKLHAIESKPKICNVCRKRFIRPAYSSIKVWNKRLYCSQECKYKAHSRWMTEHNGLH